MKTAAPFEPAICVRDLDASIAFYKGVLGMTIFSMDQVTPEESSNARLTPGGYRIARVETDRGDRIKLVQPRDLPKRQEDQLSILDRHGMSYLTFIVEDLPSVVADLRGAGTRCRSDDIVRFRPGVDIFFAEDPDGNFLEFVQRNDLDRYRPKR